MYSLTHKYLNSLVFSFEELTLLRSLGDYQGKHSHYLKQCPEIVREMHKSALNESKTIQRDRSELENAGYGGVLHLICQTVPRMTFSNGLILQLHRRLFHDLPIQGGKWKDDDYKITQRQRDGTKRIVFVPLTAAEVPKAMKKLMAQYKKCLHTWNKDPLLIIPLFILDFLCIHPFRDGNGRIARLLILLLLSHYHYPIGQYISLERIITKSKAHYYAALEQSACGWHQGKHNVKPWLTYFWGILLQAYQEGEQHIEEQRIHSIFSDPALHKHGYLF